MLKQRVLAALVMMPLVVWGVLALPAVYFGAATALIVLAGGWEWSRLMPLDSMAGRVAFCGLLGALLFLCWPHLDNNGVVAVLLGLAVAWWLAALVWLRQPQFGSGHPAFKAVLAVLVLVPAWVALNALHGQAEQGPQLVLFVMVLMWVADSSAYFSGRALGRHKLAPRVSPGKTWEGVVGGLVGCAVFAWLAGLWLEWPPVQRSLLVILALVTAALSVVGDLFISLLKRQEGLKDSGHLIPGHGGVLDRIDSLLAAAPVFLLGYGILGL